MTGSDFSRRLNYPYLTGAMLAVNAVSDAHLFIDGPDCLIQRVAEVCGRHDLRSTLLRDGACHRFWFTGVTPKTVNADPEGRFREGLRRVASRPAAARVLAAAMPMAAVSGTDYERIVRSLGRTAAKVAWLRPMSLSRDWLAGFDKALEALASTVRPARPTRRRGGSVAVVGMFPHRVEADERANRDEVRRLLEALGLEVECVWPSGGPFAELEKVSRASTIVSLPYARDAARLLARRFGSRLAETGLPFGLQATRRWLLAVGRAVGRTSLAERVAAAELAAVVPDLQWAVQGLLAGRRVAYAGEPHLLEGLAESLAECGCSLPLAAVLAADGGASLPEPLSRAEILREPTEEALRGRLADLLERGGVDLLIANAEVCSLADPRLPVVELGYPSDFSHALFPAPYLGFKGAAAFLERVARALSQERLLAIRRAFHAARSR